MNTGTYSIGLKLTSTYAVKAAIKGSSDGDSIQPAIFQTVTLSPESTPSVPRAAPKEPVARFDDWFFETAFEGVIDVQAAEAATQGEAMPGILRGYLEDCSPDRIAGWAQDPRPGAPPVQLAIMLGKIVLGEAFAADWRADLSAACIGTGHYGFEFRPATPIARDLLVAVKVVRIADNVELPRIFELAYA